MGQNNKCLPYLAFGWLNLLLPMTHIHLTEYPDGIIETDSQAGRLVGFTSDHFSGSLWKAGDLIWFFDVHSLQPGNGHFRKLVEDIEGQTLQVVVPILSRTEQSWTVAPKLLARAYDILKKNGFVDAIGTIQTPPPFKGTFPLHVFNRPVIWCRACESAAIVRAIEGKPQYSQIQTQTGPLPYLTGISPFLYACACKCSYSSESFGSVADLQVDFEHRRVTSSKCSLDSLWENCHGSMKLMDGNVAYVKLLNTDEKEYLVQVLGEENVRRVSIFNTIHSRKLGWKARPIEVLPGLLSYNYLIEVNSPSAPGVFK